MSELERQVEAPGRDWRGWLNERIAGLACLVVGAGSLLAMLIAALVAGRLEMLPPLVYTVPPLVAAAVLAVTSAARAEPAWKLWLSGVLAATAALVSGWVVVIAAVVAGLAVAFWLVGELAG